MHTTSKPLFLRARDWEDEYTHLSDAELDRLIRDQEMNLREMYEHSNKSVLKDALLKEPWREKEFPQVVRSVRNIFVQEKYLVSTLLLS